MDYQTGLFYLFAAVLLFAGYRVITARNPVHAVLYLILAFSQDAAVWLLLKAEFLGITLVLVYIGAGMVLLGGFGVRGEPKAGLAIADDAAGQLLAYSNSKALGKLLYTEYLFPVEIAAVILLVAMIAAIALTLRQRKDSKAIDAAAQIRVRASDRLELVRMAATRKAPAQMPATPVAGGEKAERKGKR